MAAKARRGPLHGGGESRGGCDRKCQEVAERMAIFWGGFGGEKWRRGESNPCPECLKRNLLHV